MRLHRTLFVSVAALAALVAGVGLRAEPPAPPPTPVLLTTGLAGATGSTIGPGGALFVTEGAVGRVSRVDPQTGAVTTFASGLPPSLIGIGGAIDVAFIGETAYVLVTLVAADVGGSDTVGIYRVDGPSAFTVVADLGTFSMTHPPTGFPWVLPTGLQYAIEADRGGFLVTDGHHNRVLRVTPQGHIAEQFVAFQDVVPTGLAVSGDTIFLAEAGPTPHLPENGKIVSFSPGSPIVTEVASGAPLLVDVEFGRGRTLYGLSQGTWNATFPGEPANPDTGALVRVNDDGSFTTVVDGLNLPTSLEIIGDTAYVVSLAGTIVKIDGISGPPYGPLP